MIKDQSLGSLENLLESFLEKVVNTKEQRLSVLEGINSLDEISQMSSRGIDITDNIGGWFAEHNRWLTDASFKEADLAQIGSMLNKIKDELKVDQDSSPARKKIDREIHRWSKTVSENEKIVLTRPPEIGQKPQMPPEGDSISLFVKSLSKMTAIFMDYSENKQHLLSVLDDLLASASIQMNKDALILSAFIIYYLKKNGYKVEPYVKKLKEAETNF